MPLPTTFRRFYRLARALATGAAEPAPDAAARPTPAPRRFPRPMGVQPQQEQQPTPAAPHLVLIRSTELA